MMIIFSLFVGIYLPDLFISSYASTQKKITSNDNSIIIEEGKYTRKGITFPCSDVQCSGWLYLPSDLQPGEKLPGIVTANPITSIKQIALPNYAERLAQAGFAILVFDYRGWGSSEGEPRNHIAPYEQVQDVKDAITWLQNQAEIDPESMGGLGVSMGGAHMLYLATFDNRLDAVVAVATAINGVNMWQGMFGEEAFNQIINQDAEDRANRFENNITQTYKNAWGMPGDSNCVFCVEEAYRYYTNAQKTYAPEFENRATVQSIQNILEYNPDFAVNLASPTAVLFIHATKDVVPLAMVEEIYNRTSNPKKLVVTDSLHTELYGTEPYITQAAGEAIKWFDTYLVTSNTSATANITNATKTTDAINSTTDPASGPDQNTRNFIQQFFSYFDNKADASIILNHLRDGSFNLGFPDRAVHNKQEFVD
jgi:fermentation-respiration switch protein FrsA (DUF1100 family)